MKIRAVAPAKVILFGEHFVVHGEEGIASAIEPYNEMEVDAKKANEPSLEYISTVKEASARYGAKNCHENQKHPIIAIYAHLLQKFPALEKYAIKAKVKKCWKIKGVGNSTSLSGAFAIALRKIAGAKLNAVEIFEDCMVADTAAHGNPSGIDATAVAYGKIFKYKKGQGASPIKNAKFGGCCFLIINTACKDGERSSTKDMIEIFTSKYTEEKAVRYRVLLAKIYSSLEKGDMEELGECMQKNHAMLKEGGVSSQKIEMAIGVLMRQKGCLGAKLSGAGGEGGAVIALIKQDEKNKIVETLDREGFEAFDFTPAKNGAAAKKLEKNS